MPPKAAQQLSEEIDVLFNDIANDYRNALIGNCNGEGEKLRIQAAKILANFEGEDWGTKNTEIAVATNTEMIEV